MERIKAFFEPKSVALIGATDRKGSVGRVTLKNLLASGEARRVYPVNPGHETVLGDIKCYSSVDILPEVPDLAVVVVPAEHVAASVEECGKVGIKSMIIITAGFKEIGLEGRKREEKVLNLAAKYDIRIMGPNCMGIIRPKTNLNTTFIRRMPKQGNIAFLSQSGALGAGILDWVISKNIGLSTFVSVGSMADVDFGDLIDFFGEDAYTRSIIIYTESIGSAKKFMSAARGFSRTKPIIVLKPGKFEESIKAALSHTGAMVGVDRYYDSLFGRAGVVRVEEIKDLFNCASILNTAQLPKGPNLAIVSNGGGPAMLATDSLVSRGGKLARLSRETITLLSEFLPKAWSRANPVDILDDADLARFEKSVETVIRDKGVNGVLIIYTPQGDAVPAELANVVIEQSKKVRKPILVVLMGDRGVAEARNLLYENNVPIYGFPEEAIKSYIYMYQYANSLETLYEMPEESLLDVDAPKNHLKTLIHKAQRDGRSILDEEDSRKFLRSYGIPVMGDGNTPSIAHSAENAVNIASRMGYPVVLKISSPDIIHRSDVGGVIPNVHSDKEVEQAFEQVQENVKQNMPEARVAGVSIHKMVKDYDYELIVGSKKSPIFGPVIMFGRGGIEAEFFKDFAVELPPLNQVLARKLIKKTKVYELLRNGFRFKPPVDLKILEEILVRFSNLIIDFPEIKEIDINPLVVKGNKAIALDEKIILDDEYKREQTQEYAHLIISPYPSRFVVPWKCRDGRAVLLRPIRPEDEKLQREFLEGLSEESMRYRFFYVIKDITHDMLTRFCNIDYDREMAIVAEHSDNGNRRNVGVGRLLIEPGDESAEFAVLVADDFQSVGLGLKLCDLLIGIGREKGVKQIYAIVLNENVKMINLGKRLNFSVERLSAEETKITLEL
ncbi:bifunctional acetate--CoA ligase family protein/GNAT family N-acetyltransferase [Chloroflexota bacterium]